VAHSSSITFSKDFEFTGRMKTTLFAFMGLGLACLALSFFMDETPHHTRFWTNYLHNTVFFTGISFVILFVTTAFITAYAGWYVVLKRLWESFTMFLIVGLVLFIPIIAGIWGHFHHLYHWADAAAVASDKLLLHKSAFLNPVWYSAGTILIVGIWYFFATRLRSVSLAEEANGDPLDFSYHRKMRFWAAVFLPIGAFTSAALIWLWVMSIDAHWYSTLYAWYCTASWWVAGVALTIMLLIFLKGQGYYQNVTDEHFHDLGKFLFAFSVFWAYLWFSQFMLIWYANVGEETVYFQLRRDEFPVLFFGNLVINFFLPFLILMRNDTKRKYGTLFFVSMLVFFGHWWDYFYMIKPGALHGVMGHDHGGDAAHAAGDHAGHAEHASNFVAGFTLPGLIEIGIFLGFTALFLYVVFHYLSKATLEPRNDVYIGESLHHHV